MSVEEVAEAIGKSRWAIYKMIKQQRGIGVHFKKNKYGFYEIDGRRVRRFDK